MNQEQADLPVSIAQRPDTGKLMMLTGASRGIGHATVRLFVERGWNVLTVSRDPVPEACKMEPLWAHHITADLGDPARGPPREAMPCN